MSHCPEVNKKDGKKNKSDDDKSRDSRSRKSRKPDTGNLRGQVKKTITILEENIDKLGDEDSELTSSDIKYSSGNRNFQFHDKPTSFTGTEEFNIDPEYSVKIPGVTNPTVVVLEKAFEERNRKVLFKNIHAKLFKLDLRNAILLDSQSNMDLFCNTKLVGNIYKTREKMQLQSNRGKMLITHKAQVAGYKPHV